MDLKDAADATREWLKPKFAVRIHSGIFPVIKGTPAEYMEALGKNAIKVFPISPGEKLKF